MEEIQVYKLGTFYGVELIIKYKDYPARLLVEKELQQIIDKKYPSVYGQENKKRLIAELKKALIDLELI